MRSRTRKHHVPKLKRGLEYIGYGKRVVGGDAVSGDPLPYKLAVRQRGLWVHKDWKKGSRDKPDSY